VQAAERLLRKGQNGNSWWSAPIAGVDVGGSSIPYAVIRLPLFANHIVSPPKLSGGRAGPEIRINAVAPGFIETRWTEDWDAFRQQISDKAPLRTHRLPDEVAESCSA